jgi:hypothetical protein
MVPDRDQPAGSKPAATWRAGPAYNFLANEIKTPPRAKTFPVALVINRHVSSPKPKRASERPEQKPDEGKRQPVLQQPAKFVQPFVNKAATLPSGAKRKGTKAKRVKVRRQFGSKAADLHPNNKP